jgi:hypothetical protein
MLKQEIHPILELVHQYQLQPMVAVEDVIILLAVSQTVAADQEVVVQVGTGAPKLYMVVQQGKPVKGIQGELVRTITAHQQERTTVVVVVVVPEQWDMDVLIDSNRAAAVKEWHQILVEVLHGGQVVAEAVIIALVMVLQRWQVEVV